VLEARALFAADTESVFQSPLQSLAPVASITIAPSKPSLELSSSTIMKDSSQKLSSESRDRIDDALKLRRLADATSSFAQQSRQRERSINQVQPLLVQSPFAIPLDITAADQKTSERAAVDEASDHANRLSESRSDNVSAIARLKDSYPSLPRGDWYHHSGRPAAAVRRGQDPKSEIGAAANAAATNFAGRVYAAARYDFRCPPSSL
jgi:hypothetical protein